MDKVQQALEAIANCGACGGKGTLFYGNGEDYDFENCECNPYEIILDEDGNILWDNGWLMEPQFFVTMEAM